MPTEISELFDRDPLNMSDQDITAVVKYEREHQTQHELGIKPPPKVARKPTKAQDTLKTLGLDLPEDLLKDLGLK
jgi:hypothetical protein